MMDIFEVATEFKFEVGQAILNTNALKDSVDDLSKSANSALGGLNYLASGLVAHLGFGSGGLLSVLTKAVQVSEAFNDSALMFSNNISSNMQVLSGDIHTFNDRLETSKQLMNSISGTAIKFGLNTSDLARMSQLIATPLASHGKLGTNYGNAINMSKNLMLGSEAVGLHPQIAGESLYRSLTDHMALHGALFARLVNTPAFKSAHVKTQGQLIGMNPEKKIDLLSKSLEQLAGDSDWLNSRLNSISKQFIILKDQIELILKPIGDALKVPIQKLLHGATEYLSAHGKELGDSISKLIGNVFDDPQKLFVNLFQLKRLGHDMKSALKFTELFQTFAFIRWGLSMLGIQLNGGLLRAGFKYLFEYLGIFVSWLWRIGAFGKIFSYLRMAVVSVMEVFLPFLFFLQIFSRALGIAKLNDAKNLIELTPRITEAFVKLKNAFALIMTPINMAIDWWANLIAPIFETSTAIGLVIPLMDALSSILQLLGKGVIYCLGGVAALTNMLIGFAFDIINLKNPFSNAITNLKDGYKDFMSKHPFNTNPANNVVNQVTNVGKIEARFDMREQLEPDRIAFAVTAHLKKLAMNPRQGRGSSLGSALVNPQFSTGAQ